MPQIGISGCPQTPLQRWPPFIKPPMLKTWIHPTMLDFKKYNLCNIRNITFSKPSRPPRGRWGGCGYSWFQVTGIIEWGQNSKPTKIPAPTPQKYHAAFLSHKIFEKALNDITRKIETLVLNTQKNSYLNQATQKNTCQNFSSPKNSSIIPITRNPEYICLRLQGQDNLRFGAKLAIGLTTIKEMCFQALHVCFKQ